MKLNLLRPLISFGCFFLLSVTSKGQNFSFNCSRDTIVPGCPPNLCITLKGIVPDIHGQTSSYSLNPGSFNSSCFPVYVAPDDPGGSPTNLSIDDRYSAVINMGFPFPFYGTTYNNLVASTNGYLSFDITLANLFSHYQNNGDLPNGSYDRALIMGPYHDLDPSVGASPTKKIQYQVWGIAPHRRWVLSFYRVPLYSAGCNNLFENTHQIILYESTGIFEVKIIDKQICFGWQAGKAMVGIQDFTRTQGMTAPLRRMSDPAWGSIGMNETWRYVPDGGPSLLKRVELYDLSNNLIATGVTGPLIPGCLEVSFANICAPAGTTTSYIIKSVYQKIDDPLTEIFGTDTVRINRSVPLTGIATPTPAGCGLSNGTITVSGVAGGTAPYEYSLDGIVWQSSNVFSGLAPGSYTVYIRDFGSVCTTTIPVTVGISGNIPATASTSPTACPGVNNGSITITSAGGTGPYTFSLDGAPAVPGTIPFTFSNVASGPHTVIVNDINLNCSSNPLNVDVASGIGITGSISTTQTSCPGATDGTITATAFTGTAPFTWQLDGNAPVPGASPYTFFNVTAGPHTVRIMDNFGCIAPFNADVVAGPGITANVVPTDAECATASNGTITVTPTNGTAPYTYALDGGLAVPGPVPMVYNNQPPGLHTIVVTDALSCSSSPPISVIVGAGPGVSGTASTSPTSCPSASNGSITVVATAGTAPFTWVLDGVITQNGPSPHTFNNVAAGTHSVTITDNFGCTFTINNIIVDAGPGITANTSSTNAACGTATNGTITVTPTNGQSPYSFSIDGGPQFFDPVSYTFNNQPAGVHTIIVTDAIGCLTSPPLSVTIAADPGVNGTATTSATSCPAASNGSINVVATAGTGPFTWVLDGVITQNGSSPHTFNNVAAGSHFVTITDNFGCTFTINNIIVNAGPPLAATTTSIATSCSGASNGSITVTPTNGISPYMFSIDGGPPFSDPVSYTFNNLSAGIHSIIVTDNVGCVTNPPITETVAVGPVLTTTANVTDVLCNGSATGTITVVQPIIGTAPYEYSLDNVTWQSSNFFGGLTAGLYTVYYRESAGCQGSHQETVSEPAAMSTSAATVAAICNGDANGIITITAGGGVTPYQYSIDGGVNWQPGNIFTVAAGTYTIIIRDANNCTTTQAATVTEPAVLTAASVNSNASCDGGNDGVITVNAVGGNSGYTYSIDGVNFQPSNIFNVTAGNYTITVIDNLGCSTTFNTVVGLTNNLTFTPQIDPTICEGNSTQLQLLSNATLYSWTPSTGLSNANISNPIASPTVTTPYTVTATLGLCTATDDVIVNVNAAPIPDAGPLGFICYGQSYQLQGSGGVQYTWTPSTYLSSTTVSNPVSTPVKTITYTLSEVIDGIGCKSLTTDQVTVDVTPPIKVKTFPYDTIGYPGDQFQINATSAATSYSWSPATGLSNPNIPNPVLTVGPIGSDILYQVIASTAAGCKGEGYVNLKVYKGPELYVPSAFTPNGDGLNDIFYPFPVGIKSINYFRVFNRWGQLLFSSTTLYKGWDGKLQGVEQPSGVYVFMAQGVDKNGKLITHNGTVTLIR